MAASLRFFVPPRRVPRSPERAGAPPGSALGTGLRTRAAILIAAATGWRGSGGNVAASLRFFVPPRRVPRSPERAGAPPGNALGTGLRTRAAILIAAATGWRGSGGNVAASLRFFVPPRRVPRSPERAGAPPRSALATGLRTRAAILIAAALVAAGGAVPRPTWAPPTPTSTVRRGRTASA